MLFRNPALAVEVVLEECNVRLRRIFTGEELLIRRDGHRRCLHLRRGADTADSTSQTLGDDARDAHLFHDALLRADGEAIVELVLSEIYLWDRLLVLYLNDSFLNLAACPAHRQVGVSGGKEMVVVKIVAGGPDDRLSGLSTKADYKHRNRLSSEIQAL